MLLKKEKTLLNLMSKNLTRRYGEECFMTWYKKMTEQRNNDFVKVIAVIITGAILILLVPMIFHIVL